MNHALLVKQNNVYSMGSIKEALDSLIERQYIKISDEDINMLQFN